MTPSIDDSWIRIEAWLAEHAPATFAGLEPPAAPEAIAAAEAAIGLPFPDELRRSLLRHDGTGHHQLLPLMWMPLGVDGISGNWAVNMEVQADVWGPDTGEDDGDPEADTGPWWHRQWIPFAGNGCGDHLVLDQRPTSLRGRIGEAYHDGCGTFGREPMLASLQALLAATATALETGEVIDGCRRTVTADGELDWEIQRSAPAPEPVARPLGRGRRSVN